MKIKLNILVLASLVLTQIDAQAKTGWDCTPCNGDQTCIFVSENGSQSEPITRACSNINTDADPRKEKVYRCAANCFSFSALRGLYGEAWGFSAVSGSGESRIEAFGDMMSDCSGGSLCTEASWNCHAYNRRATPENSCD
ncbi:MAG: hypothetical protein SGJ18_07170 [Pseudomonadota bacterium]|nr:hypothetical protein [Pseudomonadota bacterium]